MTASFLTRLIFLSSFVFHLAAHAARTAWVPPIRISSVAGGVIFDGTNNRVCTTADMKQTDYAGPSTDGVCYGHHTIEISLRNVSDVPQPTRVVILKDSWMRSNHTRGATSSIPEFTGGEVVTASDYVTGWSTIPAQGRATFAFSGFCDNSRCYIRQEVGPTPGQVVGGTSFPVHPSPCTGTVQVCIASSSELSLRIEVNENRGAILGHITTGAHRGGGSTDHYAQPPFDVFINGGRAF
jgi:hypothetical protein